MAKPIIGFKGVQYRVGQTIGFRPQLEKCENKVKDNALAEEICLEAGLSMSPTELLHALQVSLETVPRLVGLDGRVREFTDLICWNRTSSGKLAGMASDWNESCKARVLVQLKKNTKQYIDGSFRNITGLPVPKVDNVTYIGALAIQNAIKVGVKIGVYGRYLQFTTGDTAKLILPNGTEYTLSNDSSDAAHAVFFWPAGCNPEPGTRAILHLESHAGMAGAGQTINEKEVIILEGESAVRVDRVVYEGAPEGVTNEVKNGQRVAIYGANVKILTGDAALFIDGGPKALEVYSTSDTCTVFNWPVGYSPEAGKEILFHMESRGGVESGEWTISEKNCTVVA